MKKHSFKVRTILVGLLATIVTIGISVPAMANKKSQTASAIQSIQPTVSYLRSEDNTSLFSLTLNNSTPIKFDVVINDADGAVIYNQSFESSKFAKTFKLVNENPLADPTGVTFHVLVKSSGEQHSFEVASETTVLNEVEIVKL